MAHRLRGVENGALLLRDPVFLMRHPEYREIAKKSYFSALETFSQHDWITNVLPDHDPAMKVISVDVDYRSMDFASPAKKFAQSHISRMNEQDYHHWRLVVRRLFPDPKEQQLMTDLVTAWDWDDTAKMRVEEFGGGNGTLKRAWKEGSDWAESRPLDEIPMVDENASDAKKTESRSRIAAIAKTIESKSAQLQPIRERHTTAAVEEKLRNMDSGVEHRVRAAALFTHVFGTIKADNSLIKRATIQYAKKLPVVGVFVAAADVGSNADASIGNALIDMTFLATPGEAKSCETKHRIFLEKCESLRLTERECVEREFLNRNSLDQQAKERLGYVCFNELIGRYRPLITDVQCPDPKEDYFLVSSIGRGGRLMHQKIEIEGGKISRVKISPDSGHSLRTTIFYSGGKPDTLQFTDFLADPIGRKPQVKSVPKNLWRGNKTREDFTPSTFQAIYQGQDTFRMLEAQWSEVLSCCASDSCPKSFREIQANIMFRPPRSRDHLAEHGSR